MHESGGNKKKFFVFIPMVEQIVEPIGCAKKTQCSLHVTSFFKETKLVLKEPICSLKRTEALSYGAADSAMLSLWF